MDTVTINRAPVLTLWAAVVAEFLGFDREESLTLGKAVAGLTAQSKGQRLAVFTPSPEAVRKERAKEAKAAGVLKVALLGRAQCLNSLIPPVPSSCPTPGRGSELSKLVYRQVPRPRRTELACYQADAPLSISHIRLFSFVIPELWL